MNDPNLKLFLKENKCKVVSGITEAKKMRLDSDESIDGVKIPELEGYCPICMATNRYFRSGNFDYSCTSTNYIRQNQNYFY